MTKRTITYAGLLIVGMLPACTSGQSAVVPPSTAVNIAAVSKLQFAVGTANMNGTPGLNTVVTFRQTNGLSATLVNTPRIAGPAGFAVPADPNSASNADSGTNTISGSPQVASGATPTSTTFGLTGGAFAYGFAPDNSDATGSANFKAFALPFYAPAAAQLTYFLGPGNAFVSNFRNGLLPGFNGYASGFTDFAVNPVAGTYQLSVLVPTTSTASNSTFTAAATLTSTQTLPIFPVPSFVSDTAGGGSISVNVPAGCTEALIYVDDTTANLTYTLVTNATGPQTILLPDAIGTIAGGTAGQTLAVGDQVLVYAVGFDYPAIEAAPIGKSPPQTPVISGATGQADITTSGSGAFTE